MASSNSDASAPSLAGAVTLLLPWFFGMPALDGSDPREIAVFLHQQNRSITLVEGAIDDESVLREISPAKDGPIPATRASIESLPRVEVTEPGLECSICLTEYEIDVAVKVKEMPCRHRFHSNCIDKWLGKNGSCPVCRFRMPVELRKEINEGGGWRIHTYYDDESGGQYLETDIQDFPP